VTRAIVKHFWGDDVFRRNRVLKFGAIPVAKRSKTSRSLVARGFNYAGLEAKAAERAQAGAEKIRQMMRKSLDDLMDIGRELLAVKEALGHGRFQAWLDAEFGWSERMARNFMAVAARFSKTAIIADLPIEPTAAYLLAAPSTPNSACQAAIVRARAGERITTGIVKEILGEARSKGGKRDVPRASDLAPRLQKALERYRDQWGPKRLTDLARELRAFADSLDKRQQQTAQKRRQS
jgi:hypothetical protein